MATPREKARTTLRGAILGLTTPFTEDGRFDAPGLRRNIDFYVEHGIRAFVVGGTYGEVTALTQDERRAVIRTAVEATKGRAAVLADTHHVGSVEEVIAITRYAEEVGADFAYIMTPYYFRPSDRGLFEFYKRIAQAVKIGIVLYTNPWRTHVRLTPAVVQDLAQFENIVAIKAADQDLGDISDLAAWVGDQIVVSCGWEVHAIHGAVVGAPCYFGIAGNFDPVLEQRYERAIADLDRPELRHLHGSLSVLRRFFSEVDAPVALKAAQDMVGLVGGSVRVPLWPMTEEQRQRLREILIELGTKVTGR
jgi:4-hydroxy-tetrahydrodipicolinate synthase